MELYLVRHGVAEERGPAWPDDLARPLSARGVTALTRVAAALDRLDVRFDLIVSSPATRTWQTAERLARCRAPMGEVKALESLLPGGDVEAVISDIRRQARVERVAVVGHEPQLGELAARLLGMPRPFAFKKGGVCRIDFEGRVAAERGTLRWFAPPRLLRPIAS